MATDEDHAQLYGRLRAQVLARFFAYSRYFRANHVALWNQLGHVRTWDEPVADEDGATLPCAERAIRRPGAYADASSLAALPTHEVERWRIAFHERENPLLFGSYLMVALACEHALGVRSALPILRLAVDSLQSLYKFSEDFDGYPLRWDAVSSDHWRTRADGAGRARPDRCCDFYLDENYRYLWCAPPWYPGYMPKTPDPEPEARGLWKQRYRGHEPSMDEIVGLVLTYGFVYDLVPDPALRAAIRAQVLRLGGYLARFGYILVRPVGGFSARGASGALPAFEYPFGRVFARVTGDAFRSRASFEDAMRAGGVWSGVKPSMDRWGIAGIPIGTVAGGVLGGLAGGAAGALVGGLASLVTGGAVGSVGGGAATGAASGAAIGALGGTVAGHFLGRAAGVLQAKDVFDVWATDQQEEFAAAFIFKLFDTRARFWWWMEGVRRGYGRHARGFPPFIALSALGDSDTFVREQYLTLTPLFSEGDAGRGLRTAFARVVALVHGDNSQAQPARDLLEAFYSGRSGAVGMDWRTPLLEDVGPTHQYYGEWRDWSIVQESAHGGDLGALEYLACVALSWLRARRLRDSGVPMDQIGPVLSLDLVSTNTPSSWPAPSVPAGAVAIVPALRREGAPPPSRGEEVQVFPAEGEGARPEQQRTPDEQSEPSPAPVTTTETVSVSVPESRSLVRPPITIREDDSVRLVPDPNATIWSGIVAHGRTGPGGYVWSDQDPKFPLREPPYRPYSLLYKFVVDPDRMVTVTLPVVGQASVPRHTTHRWQYLGAQVGTFVASGDGALFFRTNDDAPGNGNGAFQVDVTVGHRS